MKRLISTLLVFTFLIGVTGCNGQPVTSDPSFEVEKPPIEVQTLPEPEILETRLDYLINDEIPEGNSSAIIEESGEVGVTAYFDYTQKASIPLGFDINRNMISLDAVSFNLESIPPKGKKSILAANIMGDRKRKVQCAVYEAPYLVWAECPNAKNLPDSTNGADWAVYIMNIETEELTLIDYDQGIRSGKGYQYPYLCPTKIAMCGNYIAYQSFAKNTGGIVVPVMKLYTISNQTMLIIDELKTDPTKNAIGYPSISGNLIAWPQGYVRPDGNYEGYCVLYDISTGIRKLITSENVINPYLTKGYLIAVNHPNQNRNDSEIVVYDINKTAWLYKFNGTFSQYADALYPTLEEPSSIGRYFTWRVTGSPALIVMDLKTGTRYTIIDKDDGHSVNYPILLNGHVLTWYEPEDTPNNGRIIHLYYYYLRENPID
ncbi:MAG TPA: hypothetical protein VFF80_03300 [Bacillota bacterium]|nr:hypothetical protein [Bacillota bacterium]